MKQLMRMLSLLMALVLCVSLVPVSAFAEDEPETDDTPDIMEPVEIEEEPVEDIPEETEPEEAGDIPEEEAPAEGALVPEIEEIETETVFSEITSLEECSETHETLFLDGVSSGAGDKVIDGGQRDLLWPVPSSAKLSSCFIDPVAITYGTRSSSHHAIDICGGDGAIVASYDGVVVGAGWYSGFGNSVAIRHSYRLISGNTITLYTRYSHLASYCVSAGDTVSRGQRIGTMGATGGNYGVHLDFQTLYGCNDSNWTSYHSFSIDPFINNLLEMPSGFNANGASSYCTCCYEYVNYVKELYAVPLTPPAASIDEGVYKICSSIDLSKCIEVADSSTATAANIQLGTYTGSNSQLFTIQKSGDYYKIKNVNSGLNVDVADANRAAETNIQQCVETGSNAQLWTFEDAGDGYVYIHSALGLYMDVCAGLSTDGTNIHTYTLNKSNAQKFKLTKIADKVCSISYKNASGEAWSGATALSDNSFTLSTEYPSKSGSYFCGWSYTSGSTTIDVRPGDTITVSSDITLYPVYVTHAEAISEKSVPIYNLSDFTDTGYTVTAADYKQTVTTKSGAWSNWSDYSTTAVTASSTVQVETTTLYGYYYFKCANCGTHSHGWGSGACYSWISGCGSYIQEGSWTTTYSTVNWNTAQDWHGTGKYYVIINGERWFKWDNNTATGYRYRTYNETTSETTKTLSGCIITKNAPSTSATITTSNAVAAPGGTVSVTVSIANNPGIMYLSVTPVYNTSVFTLESVTNGTVFPTAPTRDTNYTWDENSNMTGNGTLFTYTFKVKDTAGEGSYTVGVSLRESYNASEQAVGLTVNNGTVTITNTVYGDATGDGNVNGLDLVRVRKYLAAYDYETKSSSVAVSAGADATGDGNINGLDLVRLRKYLAAYDYETKTSTVVLGPTK